MKKQSGFTLIELMVVMAIIAILATAGLNAYTGYIKKARDTTRIADLAAINTIVLGEMSVNGTPPLTVADLNTAIKAGNGDKAMKDPINGTAACLNSAAADTVSTCQYVYKVCDSVTGYALATQFESKVNQKLYVATAGAGAAETNYYKVGSCNAVCTSVAAGGDCVGANAVGYTPIPAA